jgi:hypothetical protein
VFNGSSDRDGDTWVRYPERGKPRAVDSAPALRQSAQTLRPAPPSAQELPAQL